ncbi:MAG: radical SAM protein [Candidatus Pacebacteria bacterium]|nr:radical SAM protein [Candidatus Paceibacterota bacterium]
MTTPGKHYNYLFGPVPSRRLGRSLGVDLTPYKTCTLDCVFCQLGRTTVKTVTRDAYVPVADVQGEIKTWLGEGGEADYITLSGSGEPTLNSGFGEIIEYVHENSSIPVVLLSNGTLFWMPEVRESAANADIVKLSLSAWDSVSFEQVNRPHEDLDLDRVVAGQRVFRKEFSGKLWIEVFLIEGMNAASRDVERIAELVKTIEPDEVHLNTAVRPPAEDFVQPLSRERMEQLTDLFHPPAKIIAEFPLDKSAHIAATEETIMEMLQRRPCTARQIADVFGMHLNEVSKYLGKLSRSGRIGTRSMHDDTYYAAKGGKSE